MDIKFLTDIINTFYPEGIDLDSIVFKEHPFYKKLSDKCIAAYNDNKQWTEFLDNIKSKTNVNIIDNSFILTNVNPSYNAYVISGKNDLYWLVLKISVIAPVYYLYYDNRSYDQNNRFIRCNAINEYEKESFLFVKEEISNFFAGYQYLDFSNGYHLMAHLGDIRYERRKPYLDECIFGTYRSIHS